jgi:hypothetical protein
VTPAHTSEFWVSLASLTVVLVAYELMAYSRRRPKRSALI